MQLIHTVALMQEEAEAARRAGRRLALVPTMGALHEGHLALVRAARERADHVTVSIYVNPTQFAPGEDYSRYPRGLEADAARLEALPGGVDAVFAPSDAEMYPPGARSWVSVEGLDEHLCGPFRPNHFRGVTTVVSKLFLACRPHLVVFGLKDAQQFLILRRMALDLRFGIELVGVPTVREPDGLALSSRNRYLSPEEREYANVLFEAVEAARAGVEAGEQRPEVLVEAMSRAVARAPMARLEYAEVVDVESLRPVERIRPGQSLLAALAVHLGGTRLIDNVFVRAPEK